MNIYYMANIFQILKELQAVIEVINTQYARSFTSKYIEITSWKVRAYDFYSRVVKYHEKNERACERLSFMILHSEWTQIVESPFSVVICLSYENWDYGISIDTFVRCTTLICKVSVYHENTVKILSVNWEDNKCPFTALKSSVKSTL